VSSVVRSVLQGEPARCSQGNQVRDFLHVEDAAHAFVSLLMSTIDGPVNIASGQPIAVKEVVYKIANKAGRRDLIAWGAVPLRPHEPPLVCADVRRLSNEVGWSPRYDLASGLANTMAWWQDRLSEQSAVPPGEET
jgi:nucleoside-diphosphate-sugar epimerase